MLIHSHPYNISGVVVYLLLAHASCVSEYLYAVVKVHHVRKKVPLIYHDKKRGIWQGQAEFFSDTSIVRYAQAIESLIAL